MGLDQDHNLLNDAAEASLEQIRSDLAEAKGRPQQLLAHLKEYLFDPGLNVQQLRRDCGISDKSVSGEFARSVGVPLGDYIRGKRLETAKRLLLHTDLPVAKISDLVGYGRSASFSRAFSTWDGTHPSAVRALAKASSRSPEVSPEKILDKAFLRRAVLGQIDEQEQQQLGQYLQAIYPRALGHRSADSDDESQPRVEYDDGREYERIMAAELWREIAEQSPDRQRNG